MPWLIKSWAYVSGEMKASTRVQVAISSSGMKIPLTHISGQRIRVLGIILLPTNRVGIDAKANPRAEKARLVSASLANRRATPYAASISRRTEKEKNLKTASSGRT